MKYKIEKNMPIPEPNKTGGGKYPFDKMEVGDSFFIKCSQDQIRKTQTNVINTANTWRKRNNKPDFKVKSHLYENGLRIWRIK